MEIMNLILKYNDYMLNVDTIKEHIDVIENKGKVIWGIIKPKENSPGIGKDKIIKINEQVNQNIDTYAYMCTSGIIKAKGKVEAFLTSEEIKDMKEYIPEYYIDKLNTCAGGILISNIEKEDKSILDSMKRYGTINGSVAVGNQTNPLYVSLKNKNQDYIKDKERENNEIIKDIEDVVQFIKFIYEYINSKGYIYSYEDLCNFYLSLKAKPFVILAGISGTGKSRLVRLFANAIGCSVDSEELNFLSVRPDWSDNTELIGYKNITGDFIPGKLLQIIQKARKKLERPYFVCLDEMNLARAEYYLSDYLSIIESREFVDKEIRTDKIFSERDINNTDYKDSIIPENLYLIGTANMDDTTYSFSKKILDRANTIELSNIDLDIVEFNKKNIKNKYVHNNLFKSRFLNIGHAIEYDKKYVLSVNEIIKNINNILARANKQFAYRVRDEIIFYMLENKIANLLGENIAMDYQIMQKILPSISGSNHKIKIALIELFNICNPNNKIVDTNGYIEDSMITLHDAKYKKSAIKIIDMLKEFEDGFTSYWI